MNSVESFANENVDGVLNPLQVSSALGPVLATPAFAAYAATAAVAFTAGIISDAVESHHADEVSLTGPVPSAGSASELLGLRVTSIR